MKPILPLAVLLSLSSLAAGTSHAQCAGERLNNPSRLSGNTVCGRPASGYLIPPGTAADRWQEQHHANGNLVDYKLGPSHPVDPTKQVGTWSVQNNGSATATITYNYGGGGTSVYDVYIVSPAVLSFCSGGQEVVRARVKTGLTSCGAGDYP